MFHWDEQLNQIFENSKTKLIASVEEGIRTFDVNLPTYIQCDWSKDGIGYLLLQQN